MKTSKSRKTAGSVKTTKAMEQAYQKEMMVLARQLAKAVSTELLPVLKAQQSSFVVDSLADTLGAIYKRLNATFMGTATLGFAKITAEQMTERLNNSNKRKFDSSIERATGVDLSQVISGENLNDFLELSISDNVDLITSLPVEYLDQVKIIVNKGVKSGARYSDIAKQITARTGSANSKLVNRIKTIARNEVQTINAQLTLRRSESLGIKRGIYRTAGDEVVRECHKELNGVEFDLAKGAWSKTCRKFIQPGITDINCRCTYSPIIEV